MRKESNNSIPGLVNVTFDYFFPLNPIPPIDYPIMLPSFEVGVVRIEHKEGILMIDKGHKLEKKGEKKLIHRRRNKGALMIQHSDGSWNYFETDLNGLIKTTKLYTRVQIIFSVNDLRASPIQKENLEHIEKMTKSFFNKFLTSYMYGIGDFGIRLYESEESNWPAIKWLRSYDYTDADKEYLKNSNLELIKLVKLINKIKKFDIYRGYEGMNGLISASVALSDYSNITKKKTTKERFSKTIRAMSRPTLLPPYYNFLFSSIRRAHLDKEYYLSIVDLATCVEITLSYFFSIYSIANTDKKINHKGEVYNGLTKEAEIFDFKRLHSEKDYCSDTRIIIMDKLKKSIADKLGKKTKNIYGSKEWDEWYRVVWKKRCKVVHSGEKDVTRDEIKNGVELTQDIIKMIEIDNEGVEKIIQEKFRERIIK